MRACYRQAIKGLTLFLIFYTLGISPGLARKSASIVICAESGKVHHENNADTVTHPASLTKMMTLYMAFKALQSHKLSLNQKLRISQHAARQAPSKLGLKAGATITVKDAILACATKSANDAAVVLAEAIGNGSEAAFARSMTQEARKLGMKKTLFYNASGLPNKHTPNLSTAREMAILSQALYKHFPQESKIFSQKQFVYKGKAYSNHNKLLGIVPGVNGIKTGYTNAAGYNLAASMKRNNKHLIAVVLGGETRHARDRKMTHLLETTYKKAHAGKPFQNQDQYDSIDDLILEIANANDTCEDTPFAQPAIYSPGGKKGKIIQAKFSTLDDLLEQVEEKKSPPKPTIVKSKKKKSKGKRILMRKKSRSKRKLT